MIRRRSIGEVLFDAINYMLLAGIAFITTYPFIYVIFASLSESKLLMAHRGALLAPIGFSFNAYRMTFVNPNILSGYGVTIVVLVAGVSVNLLMTSMGAYVLSRKTFKLKNVFMVMIILTMYIQGGLIPRYLVINNFFGLGNNLLSLILPHAIMTMNLIIMRTNFNQIPGSLEESARIDGANDFIILFRIILPVSKAIVAVMILYYGVHHWNSWFDAMIFLRDRHLYPLQLVLREILIVNSTESMIESGAGGDMEAIGESIKYATIVIATIPILSVYPFIQKYFAKGVMIGAVKG